MEFVVLGLLLLKSMTIYELNQAFKGSISMFYSASYGSLQNATNKLLEKQWITMQQKVENGRNKKIFSITTMGHQAFIEWMFSEINPTKLETVALSKVSFLGLIPDPQDKKLILQNILATINQIDQDLHQTKIELDLLKPQLPLQYQSTFKYQTKPLEYGLRSHQMAREWVEEMIEELE